MSRYRKQQGPGDNLREIYAKVQQWISSGLGDSSIDWDDSGDDLASLDVTVSDVTVGKLGHDGTRHGFLIPNGGGWQTVQEDATAKADAALVAAKTYADTGTASLAGRVTTAEAEINTLQTEMNTAQADINSLQSQMTARTTRITNIENALDRYHPGWNSGGL